MINKKYIPGIFLQALFWFLIITLALVFREPKLGGVLQKYQITLTTFLIGILSFYVHFQLSKKIIYSRFSLKWLLVNALSVLVIAWGYYLLVHLFINDSEIQFPQYYSLSIVLFFSISGMMFQGFQFALTQREKEQNLEREKLDLELNLIRTQLNPHFLFNVLNNIDYFIKRDPDQASKSIFSLSGLLRYLLYDTAQHRMPIENEINFLEMYFDLQKQRIVESSVCTYTKDPQLTDRKIAPALFLPFLENAFIHSSLNEPGAYLNFRIKFIENKIIFSVQNSKPTINKILIGRKKGLGIELSKKRLDLLYQNLYTLIILDNETFFSAELTVHLDTNEDKMYNN